MADQTGSSVAAMRERQAALVERYAAAADADRVLADALAGAHAAAVEAVSRLNTIEAQIEGAVHTRMEFALDTPMGAREFQRFLIAKQREIIAIVAEAHSDDATKRAVLESLQPQYSTPVGPG